jgi:hypothetical protein
MGVEQQRSPHGEEVTQAQGAGEEQGQPRQAPQRLTRIPRALCAVIMGKSTSKGANDVDFPMITALSGA